MESFGLSIFTGNIQTNWIFSVRVQIYLQTHPRVHFLLELVADVMFYEFCHSYALHSTVALT